MSIVNEAANIVFGSLQTASQTIHEFLCEELCWQILSWQKPIYTFFSVE